MRLLITRAAEDAERLGAKLEALGHTVFVSPVIDIVSTDVAWPKSVVDALLATSGHAFAALQRTTNLCPETRRLMPLLLVGGRTEESARRAGFHGEAIVEPNATLLVVRIADLIRKPRRILYLAGRDRKPDIEQALYITAQVFEMIETYEARAAETLLPATISAIRAGRVDGALHYSHRSAALFLELARKAGLERQPIRHFCLSEDVAVPLKEAGCSVEIAEAPNEAALLSRL